MLPDCNKSRKYTVHNKLLTNSYKASKKISFSCKFWNSIICCFIPFSMFNDTYKKKTFWYSGDIHSVKSVQIRTFFWSIFSCIQSEFRKIRTRKNSKFWHFSRSVYTCEFHAYVWTLMSISLHCWTDCICFAIWRHLSS